VPIFATRGVRGGWQLDEQWRTRVPGLDSTELQALLLAQPRAIGDPKLAASAERAMSKLMAAMPASLRDQAATMRQRLYVDPTGWRGTTENLAALPIVQEAVSRDRVLKMDYRAPGKPVSERTVNPLGLVAKGTTWYLVAATPAGLRTFRVSRIDKPVALDRTFERPPRFDLATAWKESTEAYRTVRRYEASLRADPAAAESLRTWCRVTGETKDADGQVTIRVNFNDIDEARFLILGLGAGVEVIEPAELRDRVAATIKAMFARLHDVE
jgi:predicted DNA-binding transcriptional regulator YafY